MEAIKFSSFELNLTDEVISRIADLGYTTESLKEAIIKHEWKHGSYSPALYCGTYGKYNSGNFSGMLEFYSPEDLDNMHDAYVGVYDSEEDFAREIVNERCDLDKMMGDLAYYFNYEALARDLFLGDYYFGSHGTVLRTF